MNFLKNSLLIQCSHVFLSFSAPSPLAPLIDDYKLVKFIYLFNYFLECKKKKRKEEGKKQSHDGEGGRNRKPPEEQQRPYLVKFFPPSLNCAFIRRLKRRARTRISNRWLWFAARASVRARAGCFPAEPQRVLFSVCFFKNTPECRFRFLLQN